MTQQHSMIDRTRFVLVAPTHPGNVGGVARAMKTMGLGQLYLVRPKRFPASEATTMAVGAVDVLKQAVVTDSLAQAVADCHLVIGTSARSRHLKWPVLSPAKAAAKISQLSSNQYAAVVFGRESAGLSNEELDLCQYLVHIPCNPQFSSLNLASAAQVLAYEMCQQALTLIESDDERADEDEDSLAPSAEVERFYIHLEQVLQDTKFLEHRQPVSLLRRLRKLFNRTHLTRREVNILRGMLSAIESIKEKE